MQRTTAILLVLVGCASALLAPLRPARCVAPQAPGHQLVVLSGTSDDDSSLFSTEKLGKAAFIMVPFLWGVVDWAHPPWYDVVLDAFRG